jgi:hypothetical protein
MITEDICDSQYLSTLNFQVRAHCHAPLPLSTYLEAIGIRQPVPKARSVIFNPGAA